MLYKLKDECEHKLSNKKPKVYISKEEIKKMFKELKEDKRISGFFFWLDKIN